MTGQFNLLEEIIVDNFAGGGGASLGIEMATGRIVDIAINHDEAAIRMHRTNHPYTLHLQASVWDVDPEEVCAGRSVGLAWFSPDCKHFSKAKGGKPKDKKIRGLAWIALRWAGTVRPRVIILENVEEFQEWGPLNRGHHPIKAKKGVTFNRFIFQLRALGYDVEWRELCAADSGAPTIRNRFFLIARCDGKPIVWPTPTHGPIDSEEVRSGKLLPWRSAAEIIDWTLPMYSVFADRKEIKDAYGVDVKRPLAENTMRRVIRGVDKFTIKSGRPFLVPIGYGEREGQAPRVHDILRPMPTIVSSSKHYLCKPELSPFLAECNHAGAGHLQQVTDPIPTVTARQTTGLTAPVLAPVTFSNTSGSVGSQISEPVHTITSDGKQVFAAASLIQYHTEQTEKVRGQGLEAPLQTVDASNRYAVTAAHLVEYFGNGNPLDPREPLHTVTSRDREALIAAHMVKFKGDNLGQPLSDPLQTITTTQGQFAACYVLLMKMGSGDYGHWPEIRALLNKHCGYHLADDEILLLVFGDIPYFICDIYLRMLGARELYSAQGFPEDYIIDHDYLGNVYTPTDAKARCGNAVPPPLAAAVVRANFPEWCTYSITTMADLEKAVATA